MIMLTGSADTPSVIDINTSSIRPPIRIENATHRGLKHPCDDDTSKHTYLTEMQMATLYICEDNLLSHAALVYSWDQSSKPSNLSVQKGKKALSCHDPLIFFVKNKERCTHSWMGLWRWHVDSHCPAETKKKWKNQIKLSVLLLPFESSKSVGMNVYSLADLALIRAFCAKPSIYA